MFFQIFAAGALASALNQSEQGKAMAHLRNPLLEAEQYLEKEIGQLQEKNLRFKTEISITISEIRGIKEKNFPWWRIDRKLAVWGKRNYISNMREEMIQNLSLTRDCREAVNGLRGGESAIALVVLKKLNKYWRAYLRDNLGVHNDGLAVIITVCPIPKLMYWLFEGTLWQEGQEIRRKIKSLSDD